MASPEIFTPFWIVSLDFHVCIPKANDLFLTVFTGFYHGFLVAVYFVPWFIALHALLRQPLGFSVISHDQT